MNYTDGILTTWDVEVGPFEVASDYVIDLWNYGAYYGGDIDTFLWLNL